MPFPRGLRVKTLLLAVPLIVVFLYLSFQRQQLPALPSFVPNIHPTHNSSHAAEVSDQKHNVDAVSPPPPPPSPTHASVQSSTTPMQRPKPSEIKPLQSSTTESQFHSTSTPELSGSLIVNVTMLANDSATANTSTALNETLPKDNTGILFQQYTSNANDPMMRKAQIKFWQTFEPLLAANKPNCDPPTRNESAQDRRFPLSDGELERQDVVKMPEEALEIMKKTHADFLKAIQNQSLQMAFTPKSRGIVTTAGGSYFPIFVVSLRMLRRTGTTLPVEVFLADSEEYEESLCEEVLPLLNATCVILSHIFDAVQGSADITRYQFKVFSMMFSSFEEILFLDADAFPVHNPDQLFTSEPFREYGLIAWPDFWGSTTSRIFYDITQQNIPSMLDRASSETGELLLSKKNHQKLLLLAAYYNYYGPSHYYMLLSQGAAGEGDKETFLAAAGALNETFYATSEGVQAMGRRNDDGSVDGSAMVQHDPIQDYDLTKKRLWRVKDPSVAEAPRPFFVHAHFPKLNPETIFKSKRPTQDDNGKYHKMWTADETLVKSLGIDVEKHVWEEIKWTGCELENKLRSWHDVQGICENVMNYWNSIYGEP